MLTKLLANVMRKTVFVCSGAAAAYLFLVSILSTCNLGNSQNSGTHVFFRADYPMMHLLVIFALMGLVFWIRKMPAGGNYDKAAALVIGGWGLAAALWVLCFMEQPEHDPANVLRAARQMRQYNFSSFTGEGYLNIWAGNRNLALFFYLLSFLIGVDNYVLLRLLNVAAVVVIFLLIYKIVGEAWEKGKRTAFWSVLLCACFAPIFLYTTFIYGDIYGLCLAMAAVFAQLKCFGGGISLSGWSSQQYVLQLQYC